MNPISKQFYILAIGMTAVWSGIALAVPQWAKAQTQSLSANGKIYTVVCSGGSATISQARQEAQTDCDLQASRQIKSATNVKTLVVETETQVGFHGEVASELRVQNLSCRPLNEEVDYGQQGTVTVFLKCQYNLSSDIKDTSTSNDARKPMLDEKPVSATLSTVPKCSTIIIRNSGGRSRTISCKSNPVNLQLYPSDTEVLIRAEGYRPEPLKPADIIGGRTNVFLKSLN